MGLPVANVQQFDFEEKSRAQVTYLNAYTAVTCSHFMKAYTVDDLTFLRMVPPEDALELKITTGMPKLGDSLQLLWCDRGFLCIKDVRVSRLQPNDKSFAVFAGWYTPEDMCGISGALCWDGKGACGIVTGVQRDTKTTHFWVQKIVPNFATRVNGSIT